MTLTADQRIQQCLTADFFGDDAGRIATRQDILDALPTGPCLIWHPVRPASLPQLPEAWMAV